MTNGDKTEYIYDASGVKRGARYSIALNSMFIPLGEEQMENKANIRKTVVRDFLEEYELNEYGIPSRIVMPEGYLIGGGTNPNRLKRVYQIKDYLGNVRVELEATGSLSFGASPLKVRSTSSFYPFGMEMSLLPQDAANAQPYQVSNNELERTSINWHDFHHRWYDQQLGRFLSMDPLAEINYSISPYAYCSNDPVNRIDPWGLKDTLNTNGPVINIDEKRDKPIRFIYLDSSFSLRSLYYGELSMLEEQYDDAEKKAIEYQRWLKDRLKENNITEGDSPDNGKDPTPGLVKALDVASTGVEALDGYIKSNKSSSLKTLSPWIKAYGLLLSLTSMASVIADYKAGKVGLGRIIYEATLLGLAGTGPGGMAASFTIPYVEKGIDFSIEFINWEKEYEQKVILNPATWYWY